MKVIRTISVLLFLSCAAAFAQQQILVPTRPAGDSTNAAASTAFVQQNTSSGVLVTAPPFNATCNGTTDDSAAINAAINSFTTPGTVFFPAGKICAVASSVLLGNGTSSALSTVNGVALDCAGIPLSQAIFGSQTATPGCRIKWVGSAGSNVIAVQGPIQGFGVRNLYIDCAFAANVGLRVVSGQYADVRNNVFANCATQQILSLTVPQFGGNDTNTEGGHFDNNLIIIPNVANVQGILLTGQATDATSDTHNVLFTRTTIFLPLATTVMTPIVLQTADSVTFVSTLIFGGGSGCTSVSFDYTQHNTFPTSNQFVGLDPGFNCSVKFANNGTPAATSPNYGYGIVETNGGACVNLVNFACFGSHQMFLSPGGNVANTPFPSLAWSTFAPSPSCGTATFGTVIGRFYTIGKQTMVSVDIPFTAIGTCGAGGLTINLPNTAASAGAINGRDHLGTFKGVSCDFAAGASSGITCDIADNTAFVAASRLLMSGNYENQ